MGVPIPQERGTSSNRYTILGRIATGGMADIFLALVQTEAGVDRYLVLKRVLAERARDPLFSQMFLDEARLAAQLQHPNIAQVYDVGKLEGAYFFTMEYVHGEDVRGILYKLSKLKKQLPENLALHIAAGALAALHYAHERTTPDGTPLGVVHRDVSPSNVMVSLDGQIKLLDFGVAKAAQRSQETRSGSIKGKVAYLSPEQCQTSKVDRRTDIYALGIVLWEMLTGTRLYRRETDFATMLAITNEPVPKPSTLRSGLSPEVERVVMTALEKDPDKRYQSAAAMLEDIESVAASERLILSPTAMGKFMKELFGDKVEPWKELTAKGNALVGEPVTVTAESLKQAAEPTHTGEVLVEKIPEPGTAVLDKAPDLREPLGRMSMEMAAQTPLPPNAPVWGERTPTPRPELEDGSKVISVVEAAMPPAAASESVEGAPKSRMWIPLVGVAAAGAVAAVVLMRGGETKAPSPAPEKRAVVEAPVADAAVAMAPPADAAAMETVADAAVTEHTTAAPTPAELVAACDKDATLDGARCTIAACQTGAKAKAVTFYKRVGKADLKSVETACKAKGIGFAKAPVAAPTGTGSGTKLPKDPCKDPAYVEANPLKCE